MVTRASKAAAKAAPRKKAPGPAPAPRGRTPAAAAKKKPAAPKPAPRRRAPPPPPPPAARIPRPRSAGKRENVLSLRGDPRWRDWVHRLARHLRTRTPELIDRALIEMAEREGFRPRCPER